MPDTPMVQAWAGSSAWRVLDCAFSSGQHFLATYAAWAADPQRPRMLHYVAIAEAFTGVDSKHPLAVAVNAACQDVSPGFHRIALSEGQVSLTLCVGTPSDMLQAQDFQADEVFAPESALLYDKWALKSLARCCKRGTQIALHVSAAQPMPAAWADAGFKTSVAPARTETLSTVAVFDPDWEIKRTRQRGTAREAQPGHCTVVGAGLSGAAVARALALRGWRVTVVDRGVEPATGASGLPVGLVVPHVSADDSPRSRLSRAGTAMTLAAAQHHLTPTEDWAASGITEWRLNPATQQRDPVWHAKAGWIKPAALVRAWLQTPGVTFRSSTEITRLQFDGHQWQVCDSQGEAVVHSDMVMLANAMGCAELLQPLELPPELRAKLQGLHAMFGTLSLGPSADSALAPTPVNGIGSFVPHVPAARGAFWAAGATFETQANSLIDQAAQHQLNLERLRALLPEVAQALALQFATGTVRAWTGERCVTHDRLPWVGPVDLPKQPGLWVCAGMGARGLSFSALSAELLAARLGAEPLPIDAQLARSLDINRPLGRSSYAQAAIPSVADRISDGD